MTFEVETEGFGEAIEKLEWMRSNHQEIGAELLRRVSMTLADAIGGDEYLHLVEIPGAGENGGSAWGVSLEPDAFETELTEIASYLMFYVSGDDADKLDLQIEEANPWVFNRLPDVPKTGFFWLRHSDEDELAIARTQNDEWLRENGHTAIDPEQHTITAQWDVAYNVARAEFGIDAEGREEWIPALRDLSRKQIPVIFDQIVEEIAEGRLRDEAPNFEDRSLEWLQQNQQFMMFVWQGL